MNPVGMLFPLSRGLLRPALVRGGSAFKDVPARARKNERRRSNKPAQAPYGSNRPGAIAMTQKSSSAAVGRRSATMCSMLPGRAERRVFKLRLQRKRIHSPKRPQASRKENLHRTISGIPAGNAGAGIHRQEPATARARMPGPAAPPFAKGGDKGAKNAGVRRRIRLGPIRYKAARAPRCNDGQRAGKSRQARSAAPQREREPSQGLLLAKQLLDYAVGLCGFLILIPAAHRPAASICGHPFPYRSRRRTRPPPRHAGA